MKSPKAKRVEFRAPDPTSNLYPGCSTILKAGVDRICNEIDLGERLELDSLQCIPFTVLTYGVVHHYMHKEVNQLLSVI